MNFGTDNRNRRHGESNNTCFLSGVRVQKSGGDVDIHARVVISAAGIYNTFETLLDDKRTVPEETLLKSNSVRHGYGAMSVYVGLKGTKEDFGLKAQNVWAFTGNDVDKITREFLNMAASSAGTEDIPLLFISFPSTKDPEWEKRHPGKGNCFHCFIQLTVFILHHPRFKGLCLYFSQVSIFLKETRVSMISSIWLRYRPTLLIAESLAVHFSAFLIL